LIYWSSRSRRPRPCSHPLPFKQRYKSNAVNETMCLEGAGGLTASLASRLAASHSVTANAEQSTNTFATSCFTEVFRLAVPKYERMCSKPVQNITGTFAHALILRVGFGTTNLKTSVTSCPTKGAAVPIVVVTETTY